MKANLGTWAGGGQATIDLPRLLETRMLIQANSGGGKSWAIRRLLEQTAGQVQQLVIDPEGEFATLREKFDYVIAAPHDGDAIAHPRTAGLLARDKERKWELSEEMLHCCALTWIRWVEMKVLK